MAKVKVLDTGFDSFSYEKQLFEANGYDFEVWPGEKGDVEGKMEFAADAEGLLIRWTLIDDAFLARMNGLKAIARYGVGYENIDLDATSKHGVKASNVQGYGNHAVSDHALALMYACNRMLPQGERHIRQIFGAAPDKRILDFHECTLGIVGLGRIGGTLSRKANLLFKEVIACDPYISDGRFSELDVRKVPLEELMRISHIVSIHCNLTDETENLLNRRIFQLARRKPIIINTARGPVINQTDLLEALDTQHIFAAGIDVYNTELAQELPEEVLNHPSIISTGHYAWYSQQSHIELQKRAADNLLAMLQGKLPEDCLNP